MPCRLFKHQGKLSMHSFLSHMSLHDDVIKWKHFAALLAICAGNSPVSGEFPAQRPVTRSFDVFFDLRLNIRLSKQWQGWWFERPSCSLWRHCNGWCESYDVFRVGPPRALYYNCGMTLLQDFWPMEAQLSLKAALPLAESIATASDRCGNTGPCCLSICDRTWAPSQRAHDAIITSLWRQNDVATSFWR